MSGALTSAMRDVGQRAERAERDRRRLLGAERLDDEVDAVLGLELHRRLGQVGTVEAGLAVDMLGGDQLPPHRPLAAGIDRDFGAPGELDDLEGVPRGQAQADIAGDGDDAEDVEFSGEASARRIATASSWPGSVSMMIGRGVMDGISVRQSCPSGKTKQITTFRPRRKPPSSRQLCREIACMDIRRSIST